MMTVNELANYLNCSESLIRKQLRENQLKSVRIGTKILFDREDIDEWIKKQLQNNPNDDYEDITKRKDD